MGKGNLLRLDPKHLVFARVEVLGGDEAQGLGGGVEVPVEEGKDLGAVKIPPLLKRLFRTKGLLGGPRGARH
mgnify:CR=1 FL=1